MELAQLEQIGFGHEQRDAVLSGIRLVAKPTENGPLVRMRNLVAITVLASLEDFGAVCTRVGRAGFVGGCTTLFTF